MRATCIILFFVAVVPIVGQSHGSSRHGIIVQLSIDDPSYEEYFIRTGKGKPRVGGGGIAKDYGPDYVGPALPPGYSYRWAMRSISPRVTRLDIWVKIRDGRIYGGSFHARFMVRGKKKTLRFPRYNSKLTVFRGLKTKGSDEF